MFVHTDGPLYLHLDNPPVVHHDINMYVWYVISQCSSKILLDKNYSANTNGPPGTDGYCLTKYSNRKFSIFFSDVYLFKG